MIAALQQSLNSLNDDKLYDIIDINEYVNIANFNSAFLISQLKCNGDYLFQQEEHNDNKRRQIIGDMDNDEIKSWYMSMCDAAKSINRKLSASPVTIIVSEEGCIEQRPHYDFNNEDKYLEKSKQSYLAILAIMEKTKLVIFIRGVRMELDIPIGHMLVARGDLLHAGSSYAIDHVRLHIYLDRNRNGREVNMTYFHDLNTNISVVANKYRSFYEAAIRNVSKARIVIHGRKAANFLIGQNLMESRKKKRNEI